MYRINHYGLLKREKQLEIIKCFLKNEEELLFQHLLYDNDIIINVEQENQKYDYFEDFCMDIIYYYNTALKDNIDCEVKSILLLDIVNKINITTEKKKVAVEKLFRDMKDGNTTMIPSEVLEKIVDIVYMRLTNSNIDSKKENFALERERFINKIYLDEKGEHILYEGAVLWYEPRNKQEYLDAMNLEVFYSCIILGKNQDYTEFTYGFVYCETAEDYDLIIIEKNEKDFQDVIKNKIRYIVPDIINLIEKV